MPHTQLAVQHVTCTYKAFRRPMGFRLYLRERPCVWTRTATIGLFQEQCSVRTGIPMQLQGSFYSMLHTYQRCRTSNPGSSKERGTWDNVAPIYAKSLSIRELVEQICNLAGVKFEDLVKIGVERLGKDQSYLLDSSAIRQMRLVPTGGLEGGLGRHGVGNANLRTLKTMPRLPLKRTTSNWWMRI